jgi:hypothetical protein
MTQDEFSQEAIRRAPVAEGTLTALAVLFSEERIAALYERHRGASYEGVISFHSLVELMYSAVIEHKAVGSSAFQSARKTGKLSVSDQAAYGKIRRVQQSLSNALVCDSMKPLMEMFPEVVETRVPACFSEHNVFCIDGKKLKDVARRLRETRSVAGRLLGGKALVALSVHEQLVVAMSSSLDGETNDGPLVPELLTRLHQWSPKDNIVLADSQFCDLTTPRNILAQGSDFVVRYHPKVHFHADSEGVTAESRDNWGRLYADESGWLGKPHGKTSLRVRRITVKRENAPDLIVVTSLQDTEKFAASDVLDLYSLRWTIETAFQHVTEEFDLRHMIGSTAEATLFQFAISLVIYNVMRLIQAHVSQACDISPEDLSVPKISRTAKKQIAALSVLVSAGEAADRIQSRKLTASQVAELLSHLWHDDWLKARKKKRTAKTTRKKQSGAHTSVYRAIQKYYAKKDV